MKLLPVAIVVAVEAVAQVELAEHSMVKHCIQPIVALVTVQPVPILMVEQPVLFLLPLLMLVP